MKKTKLILIPLLITVILMLSSMNAFALTATELQTYANEHKLTHISDVNKKTTQPDATWISVTCDNVIYFISPAGVQEAEAHLAQIAQDAQEQEDVVNQLHGLNDMDLTPDLGNAMASIEGFLPAIRFVLGFMVGIITVGMTLFTACDIAYILFPVFRGKCETMKQSGNSMAIDNSRSQKSGETKLRFISDEAEYSVRASETVQTGKNPLTIYLGKRIVSHLVLGVVLVILLTGNITILTDIVIKAVSGIIKLIQQMAQ